MSDPLATYTLAEIREALEAAGRLAERVREIEDDEWLEAKEACAYLKMSESAFKKRAAGGEFTRYSQGASYVYLREDLRAWQRARRVDGKKPTADGGFAGTGAHRQAPL